MGAMQNNNQKVSKSKGKRGSVNNQRRLDAFKKNSKANQADWGGCNPQKIQGVVEGITAIGGAVTFGLSRDMGAHSLALLLDGERETLWFNGDAELDDELDNVMGMLEAMVE